jgi:hypothetical protein
MKRCLLILILLISCTNADKSEPVLVDGTGEMVKELQDLYINGDPLLNYHWNAKLAELNRAQLEVAPDREKINVWFQYCRQLLYAGKVDACINEIETFISSRGIKYHNLIAKGSLPIIELLALAYLRKGELDNCRDYHNEFSCILPLQAPGFHVDKQGSQKALDIYTLILEKFPSDRNRWLLNLAYMTMGLHPNQVPKSVLIDYPNWDAELKEFPAFKERAMGLGVAENGLSGGVCADDFDGDGLLDLFVTSYGMQDQCRLYRNTGKGFVDVTAQSGLNGIVSGLNCIQADYDNDGDQDILILRGAWLEAGGNHPNSLLQNDGQGNFIDVTRSAGVLSYHPTQTAAWADVNSDGYLDLFIGNESKGEIQHPCELFINQKNGRFKEMALDFGLGQIRGFVKGVSFGDFNNDKWPDLFVSIMGGNNLLFKNEQGVFKEISQSAGIDAPVFSFPCWFWDVNNDGYDDIMVNSYDPRMLEDAAAVFVKEMFGQNSGADLSKLYINNGDNTFSESSEAFGLDHSFFAMGSNFGDLDNDGWLDFYIGTGAPEMSALIPNRMFRNNAGSSFSEVTSAGRFGHIQKGHGVSFADFDQDGDQDVYAVLGGAFEGDLFTNVYFENPIEENNWIVIELEGTLTNRNAIGTKILLTLEGGRRIYSTVNSGGSFGSNSAQAEIGLGLAKQLESVEIFWQNSPNQIVRDLLPNTKYRITEGKEGAIKLKYNKLDFGSGENAGSMNHMH